MVNIANSLQQKHANGSEDKLMVRFLLILAIHSSINKVDQSYNGTTHVFIGAVLIHR